MLLLPKKTDRLWARFYDVVLSRRLALDIGQDFIQALPRYIGDITRDLAPIQTILRRRASSGLSAISLPISENSPPAEAGASTLATAAMQDAIARFDQLPVDDAV